MASLVVQSIKSLPEMQETLVQFLGQEDALEKEMVTYSGKAHGQRSLVGYSPWGHKSQTQLSN